MNRVYVMERNTAIPKCIKCDLLIINCVGKVGKEWLVYGVPSVSKTLTNAVFIYLPLIYKYGTDLAKYLPDLYISTSHL